MGVYFLKQNIRQGYGGQDVGVLPVPMLPVFNEAET
jgi:hypothetical protein